MLRPRSVTGPRTGAGGLDADLWAGWAEALAAGFVVEDDGALAFRHESIGRAVALDLLPIPRTRYHAALAEGLGGPPSAIAWHWLAAHDPHAARSAAIEAAGFAAERHAAADELAALEQALSLPDGPAPGGAAPPVRAAVRSGRPRGPGVRGRLRGRADPARDGVPRGGDRSASMPAATASASASSTSAWPRSGGRAAIRPGRCSRPGVRSSSSRASRARNGRPCWPAWPS